MTSSDVAGEGPARARLGSPRPAGGGPVTRPLRHPQRPCAECPWRRDQPLGRFPAGRFTELADTCAGPAGSAPPTAPMFACHKTAEGHEVACAGWLAVEGPGHVGARIAVVLGRLDEDALCAGADWPQLYRSYDEMAAANGAVAAGDGRGVPGSPRS